ncbi:hypothetical protein [Exiguobacterium artemiae]|uniref:hypothetical protein n=1 Tax=Exiguobacterium artemiae TaxID=340145 RepID=UPI00047E6CD3|nr:hypothetical protein [Exiguobacterium sibiricum]
MLQLRVKGETMQMIIHERALSVRQCIFDYYQRVGIHCLVTIFTEQPLQLLLDFDSNRDELITPQRRSYSCRHIRAHLVSALITFDDSYTHVYMTKAPFTPLTRYCLLIV